MVILAIETSCDETAIAILKVKEKKNISFKILANAVSSQVKLHQKYGGVYPFLAKREHQKNLPLVLKKTLNQAEFSKEKNPFKKIDLIALTVGPGLEPCLWTGTNFVQEISEKHNLPIIPINHIEAHLLTNWIRPDLKKSEFKKSKIKFPAICLIVSGGHSQLVLMEKFKKYQIIGETRDDAAGECFDKTARILGLEYPGGPIISKKAKLSKTTDFKISLPRPMIYQKNYDFSFSGLKTSVLYDFKKRTKKITSSEKYIQEMSKEIEQAIVDVLIFKTMKAIKNYQAKTVMLAGGVSANNQLTNQLEKRIKKEVEGVDFLKPIKEFSTDNAVMVGIAAFFNKEKKTSWKKIRVNANLRI